MTKRTVAKSRAKTKARTERAENKPPAPSTRSRSEQPVDSEIRRAAKRAGIAEQLPTPPRSHLTPEDEAILARRASAGLMPRSGRQYIEILRGFAEDDNAFIAHCLREEGRRYEQLAKVYEPVTADAALAAALDVIDHAEASFEHTGLGGDPEEFMRDALHCAQDDLAALDNLGADSPAGLGRRAELRVDLALKLHAFRKAHGYPKAASSEQRGGAS